MQGAVHPPVHYDLLVGADGANSAVRSALAGQVPGFRARVVWEPQETYKTFSGLSLSDCAAGTTKEQVGTTKGGPGFQLAPGLESHAPHESLYTLWPPAGRDDLPVTYMWMSAPGVMSGLVTAVQE